MFDILSKLGDVKKKMDEIKSRLDAVTVDGDAGNGKVLVTVTGNRKLKSIHIDNSLLSVDVSHKVTTLN